MPKFLAPIDLTKQELQNARVQNLGTPPSSPVTGQIYYDTSTSPGKLYYWNGSTWVDTSGGSGISPTIIDAKGDLIVGTAADTPERKAVGSDGTFLVAASGQSDGLQWRTVADSDLPSTITRDSEVFLLSGYTTKGDIGIATANATVSRHGVGSNGTFLVANSANATGWENRAITAADISEKIATTDLTDWPRTTALDLNSQKITGLADGTAATDAASFGQLNAVVQGRKYKDPVLWSTTANISLSGLATQAGGEWTASLTAGDRILAKNQSSAGTNGIYIAAAGAWARAEEADTAAEINQATTLITNGATLQGDTYTQTATVTTLGTDPQTWTKTGEGNTVYTADGTTIELVGNSFRVATGAAGNGLTGGGGSALAVGQGTGISVSANDVAVDTSVVPRKYTASNNPASTTWTVTHSLNSTTVVVQVRETSGGAVVYPDIAITDANTATISFGTAPTINTYTVVVIG